MTNAQEKYGKWTVLDITKRLEDKGRAARWLCRCECGIEKYVSGYSLRKGTSTCCPDCSQRRKDLLGKRFGRLVVDDYAFSKNCGNAVRAYWNCVCDCGNTAIVPARHLLRGCTVSCGCKNKENQANVHKLATKHGQKDTMTYSVWKNMRARCNSKSSSGYYKYGALGTKVCERWNSYTNFLEDMGERPSKEHTLDRIDPGGNYEPHNCRWLLMKDQCHNRKITKFVQYQGQKYAVAVLARMHNISGQTLRRRLAKGKSIEEALSL